MTLTKTPASPSTPATCEDATIAACWGMTPAQWSALTIEARSDYRNRVVFAPFFRTVMG